MSQSPRSEKASALIDRLVGSVSVLRISGRSRSTQTLLLTLAGAFLLVGAIATVATGTIEPSGLHWGFVFGLLVTSPLPLIISVLEYKLAARFLASEVGARHAVRVAVLGHTANYLPVPGGPLLRIADLQAKVDQPPRHVAMVIAAIGMAWLATGGIIAAWALVAAGEAPWGAVLAVVGLGAGLFTWLLLRSTASVEHRLRAMGMVLALEVTTVMVTAGRLALAMLALGLALEPGAVFAMAAAGPLAAALGIVPGGLGIKEGLAALLGGVVGLVALEGFAMSLLIRIIDSLVVALVGLASTWKHD